MALHYWFLCVVWVCISNLVFSARVSPVNTSLSSTESIEDIARSKRDDASAIFESAMRRYVFSDTKKTPHFMFSKVTIRDRWAANEICHMMGGTLVPLEDRKKFYTIQKLLLEHKYEDLNFDGFYVGASNEKNKLMYQMDYKSRMLPFWEFGCNGRPEESRGENCLAFLEECAWYLNDIRCSNSKKAIGFICQRMIDMQLRGNEVAIRKSIFYEPVQANNTFFYISRMGIGSVETAVSFCRMIDCELGRIENRQEMDALRDALRGHSAVFFKRVYISGTDESYEGRWVHQKRKKPLVFFSWQTGYPSGWRSANCLAILDEDNMGDVNCARNDLADGDSFACRCSDDT